MMWQNKVSTVEPTSRTEFHDWDRKQGAMMKWCLDNLSTRDVLWKYDVENLPGKDVWSFYFAHPQDAVVFRLTHGI